MRPGVYFESQNTPACQVIKPSIYEQGFSEGKLKLFQIPQPIKIQAFPDPGQPAPPADEKASSGGVPIFPNIRMTLHTQAGTVVMAETALQGQKICPMNLAQIILEEVAPVSRIMIPGNFSLAALESRGKDPERMIGCYLQHHSIAVPGVDRPCRCGIQPPARAGAIPQANFAAARFGRWVLFG